MCNTFHLIIADLCPVRKFTHAIRIIMKRKILHILTAVALISFPKIQYAQAPDLGTAANFVLFTTIGAVSNSGIPYTTRLTGNVGTNSAPTITGFGNVDGQMHYVSDPASAVCAADLLLAYNELDIAIPTFFPAPLLGSGQILDPGVYYISSPATLDLDLSFDALGDPDAVFIIQIDGTFSTSANAKVKLLNGALACNIFWKVEGMVDLATGTFMRGTIIANNAAINLSVGDTLEGRALSTTGAITTNGIFGYTPIGCGSSALIGPLAPALGSTECYSIFSSIGSVTNVGISNVTGDIGTNSALTTGFDPLLVDGMIHPIPDVSTAACEVDLGTVYASLIAISEDIELLYPALFGHNLIITPHTYLMNSAVSLTDTVFLNAQGDPNAVFVIKVNGAFNTSVNSRIVLINGAQAKNVYWKIDGAVTISDNSIFEGTMVVAGAINLMTGVELNGRALTTNGALNTTAVMVNNPAGLGVITPPIDQIVCEGDSVSFSTSSSGLTYQWRIGAVDLVDGGNISGATTSVLTINPAGILDASLEYNVIISSNCSPKDTSDNVSLTVELTTIITTEPISHTACIGSSTSFTVDAAGTDLTYQWRNGLVVLADGGAISGATSPVLTINPVNFLDASANYNVIVSGNCGNDTSVNVTLIVDTLTLITLEPLNETICESGEVSFMVDAEGTDLTYQWRNGLVDLVDGGSISGATSAVLTINPVNLLHASPNYNVIVYGACGNDTSINVELIVDPLTLITLEPTDALICEAGEASFTVVSVGTGLSYQWRKGLVDLVDGGNIAGATSPTLTLDPVDLLDVSSNYNVIVYGACGNDTSVNVELIVDPLTLVTTQPIDQSACVLDEVSFTVAAEGIGLTYQWRNGLVVLVDGDNISGATTPTLTINPVDLLDVSTTYNVIIYGTCGNDTSVNVALTLNDGTLITVEPTNQANCADGSVNLNVVATGMVLTYQWRKGAVALIDGGNIGGATTATLTIDPITAADEASDYNVIVIGTCGSDTSVNVSVSISPMPVATASSNSPVCFGETINLTAATVTDAIYSWTGPDAFTSSEQNTNITSAANSNEGTYTLSVTVAGCTSLPSTINVAVGCEDFHIPNGFSPNGDGVNDLFIVRGITQYPSNQVEIFNRWGNKVFGASPYQNNWDGTSTEGVQIGGGNLPVGTYFYVFDLGEGTIYKGTIYLNR